MQPSESGSSQTFGRVKEYVELHGQIEGSLLPGGIPASVDLLDSLETFLSTFQKDLSAVSGQISDLQERSKDIDNRLKSRRKIERPLTNLISDITIPPSLATQILDTEVSEAWLPSIEDFEQRLQTSKSRMRVKAARDLGDVTEGLRIVVATKLRAFFLALFMPLRTSVTTNMHVLQTSILMKYRPLYAFLQRQAPNVAHEIRRSYIGAARAYYETGFRRYIRSLGWIKARAPEKSESFVSDDASKEPQYNPERLAYSRIEGKSVTLAFMGDDKSYREPQEAIFRSLMLVLMDNATAEYQFISQFFNTAFPLPTWSENALFSPGIATSSRKSSMTEQMTEPLSLDYRGQPSSAASAGGMPHGSKEEQSTCDTIWKQVLEPVLDYTQTFVKTIIDSSPPVLPLLTMIRLAEDVIEEVQRRGTPPLESFIFNLRLQMWPGFQKTITAHVEEIKHLAEGSGGGYFSRATATTDSSVSSILRRYVVYFNSFVALSGNSEEAVIFSNLLRLRQEVLKVINRHISKITGPANNAAAQCSFYETVLQGLSGTSNFMAHPKSQEEVAHWAKLEEEARRKMSNFAR